ncbi:MAG: hypothetical protein HQL32_15495, partial [Planctomycetes bacterium]|nr:hypothetical protein [Planctomycetota bacterium]
GLAEVDFVLMKGLKAGVGVSHTELLGLSPRFGLYVEDQDNTARSGGIYFLKDEGGGIELSWPLKDRWSFNGDFGMEKDDDKKNTRLVAGLLYRF